ncbi:amidohydrolase family protein [Ferrimonas marina]|uniref:amidohydrolase family protein n=1 Tax=Ferrimonas marina TaxID=299255 RepID=UPI001356426C|nr:amidohydrolase family protein [Ferrimonas marina]
MGISEHTPNHTALSQVTVVTAPGEIINNATVVLKDGKILSVSPSHSVPEGAFEIALPGHYVYAGFIDPFTQYGLSQPQWQEYNEFPLYQVAPKGAEHPNPAVKSHWQWASQFQPDPDQAKQWQQNGFTHVHSAWQDGIFRGQGFVASLAPGDSSERTLNASTGHWLSFDKGSSELEYPSSLMGSMALIRQTLDDALWYRQQQGKAGLAPQASLSALAGFNKTPLWFAGGYPDDVLRIHTLLTEFDAQPVVLGSGLEFERLSALSKYRARLILPLKFAAKPKLDNALDGADVRLMALRHWERSPGNAAAVAQAGLPFALTQHGIEADQFWPRLRQAMSHGLSNEDALAALTTTPAQWLGLAGQLGKVAPGYQADLVISQGDLFAEGRLHGLVLNGHYQPLEPNADLAGSYQLDLEQHQLILSVTRDQQWQGTLEQGEAAIELHRIRVDGNTLHFQAELSELGLPGIAQFTLQRQQQRLWGSVHLPSGEQLTLQARATATLPPEAEAPAGPEPEYVSQLTWPNGAFGVPSAQGPDRWHIKGATVWTSTEAGVLEQQDLLVSAGKIEAMGENLITPKGYRVVDGRGRHLTAGIVDEHAHIALQGGINEASDNNTAEVRIGDVLDPSDIHIYRALAGGVTTAQILHGSANPIGGQSAIIKLRWGEQAPDLVFEQAPPAIKLALGENVKQANWGDSYTSRYPQTRMGVEAMLRDAFTAARDYQRQQQAYQGLRRTQQSQQLAPRPNHRLQPLVEILERQRHIHVHSYVQSEVLALIHLAKELDFPVQTFTHILEGYKVAQEMAEFGTSASTFADWWAYKFEVYDAIPQNACLLTEAGVLTSINSDSNDLIRKLNQEAAKSMMYCGMSPEQAWNMVTINPARQLKVDPWVGSIEVGKHADLVLWSAPPLSVYARVEQTWVDGQSRFSRSQDRELRQQQAKERWQLVQKVLRDDGPDHWGEVLTPPPSPTWHCETLGQHGHHHHGHHH